MGVTSCSDFPSLLGASGFSLYISSRAVSNIYDGNDSLRTLGLLVTESTGDDDC